MKKTALLLAASLLLLAGCASPAAPDPTPTPVPAPAQADLSRLDRGIASLRYTGETGGRVKVQITQPDGALYNYDLDRAGAWESYPLTQGDGTYTLTVLEQVEGKRYLPVWSQEVTLSLADPNAPFLEPSQFVNYTASSAAVLLAGELTAALDTDLDKTAALFDYVVDHVSYDWEKEPSREAGYLPDVDGVLAGGTGICFDYAALLCAMLRSQAIPCKLQVGEAGTSYHAWVEVWCGTSGTIDGAIPVAAGAWTLLDPTFVSTKDRSPQILSYVTDPSNYSPRYTY